MGATLSVAESKVAPEAPSNWGHQFQDLASAGYKATGRAHQVLHEALLRFETQFHTFWPKDPCTMHVQKPLCVGCQRSATSSARARAEVAPAQ